MLIRSCDLFHFCLVLFVSVFKHIDHYSRTKAIAERLVLAANGRSTKGTEMETCWSLRLIPLLRTIAISTSIMYPARVCVCVHC